MWGGVSAMLNYNYIVTPQLPKEWTKYACGQTNDQKDMTDKARSFILQCRPRTLNFEEDANN